ncbi:MAG: single-stranded-DNA-specific exonuclease RecJ [Lachnospiraceae bacterium]|nr:single-stranded-DNA-specific exonuclease RecJ [Lachnospiraceae bacterium]
MVQQFEKWVELHTDADIEYISRKYGISSVVAKILSHRDVTEEGIRSFLSPSLNDFHDPFMLYGMERVVLAIKDALLEQGRIRIIGDYDVDGICSTYILYRGLRFFGGNVDCVIPHRIADGYGINMRIIERAQKDGVGTIITCDNGISASEEVKKARDVGMRVIVTDHHEVPYEESEAGRTYRVPDCDGLVDPKLPEDEYPFKGICGAFVAYKVIMALAGSEGCEATKEFQSLKDEFTELAALATVCDVMELKDENRSLVVNGMKLMEHSGNIGIRSLIEKTGLTGRKITAYMLGFVLGPCINASGRIASPLKSLALIAEPDPNEASKKAAELTELNNARKEMTAEWAEKAFKMLESAGITDKVIVVYLPGCHESLAGIIAGRIREKYVRPTYVLTDSGDGLIKGSGRGIEAYDMYEGLIKAEPLLVKFGGHKLAAGVTLKAENLDAFRTCLNENCRLTDEDCKETVRVDARLPLYRADMALAREIARLEPFGTGNETPLFMGKGLKLTLACVMGKSKNAAKYRATEEDGLSYEMLYFGDFTGLNTAIENSDSIDVLYTLSINEFRGKESVQLIIKHFRISDGQ